MLADRQLIHDMRGRLNGILGFAELLRDGKAGPVNADQHEFLGDILTSARELETMLTSIASRDPPERAIPSCATGSPLCS